MSHAELQFVGQADDIEAASELSKQAVKRMLKMLDQCPKQARRHESATRLSIETV
jgi:hypothetical protein